MFDGHDGSEATRRRVVRGIGAAGVVAAAGCVSAPRQSESAGTTRTRTESDVAVTLSDYDITLSSASVPPGSVTFDVENVADQVHEFLLLRTDRAPDDLPTTSNGNRVDVDAASVTELDEVADLDGGASGSMTLDLESGSYVGVCNIPGHYKLGMYAGFTVE